MKQSVEQEKAPGALFFKDPLITVRPILLLGGENPFRKRAAGPLP